MWVISRKRLREFWEEHRDAETPLRHWYWLATRASWASLVDARRVFPHADAVKATNGTILTVFNVAGNKYRLVARIEYTRHKVYVQQILTHAEYDMGKWKEFS